MVRTRFDTYTVALSGTTTPVIPIYGTLAIGLQFPVVTSCQAFLQVAVQSGGPYSRVLGVDGSAQFAMTVGAGSISAILSDLKLPFSHAKVELGVAQAAIRSLQITYKL